MRGPAPHAGPLAAWPLLPDPGPPNTFMGWMVSVVPSVGARVCAREKTSRARRVGPSRISFAPRWSLYGRRREPSGRGLARTYLKIATVSSTTESSGRFAIPGHGSGLHQSRICSLSSALACFPVSNTRHSNEAPGGLFFAPIWMVSVQVPLSAPGSRSIVACATVGCASTQ
jgi:hypothetical protein